MKQQIIKLKGFNCPTCVLNLDLKLEDIDGVFKADTNYQKQEIIVQWDEKKAQKC